MDKRLHKQYEKQIQFLHDQWEKAINETPGIGKVLSDRIISKRRELAAIQKYKNKR